MAELPEKDKLILFGQNYREMEAQALVESGVTDAQNKRDRQIGSAENSKLSSVALIVIGIALLMSAYFRPNDGDHVITGIVGVLVLVLGTAWRVHISRRISSLNAANQSDATENGEPTAVAAAVPSPREAL